MRPRSSAAHEHDVGVHRPRRLGDRRVGARADATSSPRVRSWRAVGVGAATATGRRSSALRLPAVPPLTNTPPALGGQAGEVGDPAQRLVLGEHRAAALQPRAGVDARRADDEVEQDRRLGRRRRARTTRSAGGRSEMHAGASTSAKTRSASRPPMPVGGDRRARPSPAARPAVAACRAAAGPVAPGRRRTARSPASDVLGRRGSCIECMRQHVRGRAARCPRCGPRRRGCSDARRAPRQ